MSSKIKSRRRYASSEPGRITTHWSCRLVCTAFRRDWYKRRIKLNGGQRLCRLHSRYSIVSVGWASAFVGSDVVEGEVGMSGNIRCSILAGDATSSLIGWLHVRLRIWSWWRRTTRPSESWAVNDTRPVRWSSSLGNRVGPGAKLRTNTRSPGLKVRSLACWSCCLLLLLHLLPFNPRSRARTNQVESRFWTSTKQHFSRRTIRGRVRC